MIKQVSDRLIDKAMMAARRHSYPKIMAIIILSSEVLALLADLVEGYLWRDGLSADMLLSGALSAFVVSACVGAGIIVLVDMLRRSEEKAREEKNKLETILSGLGEGVYIMDPDFRITYQNRAHKDQFGEHLGENCYRVYHGREAPCEECPVRQCIDDGEVHKMCKEVVYTDGTRSFEVTSAPLFGENGELTNTVEIFREVTDAKRAERSLKDSELRYRSLIEQANDAILVADVTSGVIIEANLKAGEMFGRPVHEIVGMRYGELGTHGRENDTEEIFNKCVREGQTVGVGLNILRTDGEAVPVELSCKTMDIGGRRIVQGIFHDLSYRKEDEKRKFELLAMLRHDMKSPLTVISGSAQNALVAGSDSLPDDVADCLHAVIRNAGSLAGMINDLAAVLSLEYGPKSIKKTPADISLLLLETTMDIKDRVASRGLKFTREIQEGLPKVHVDEANLKRAVSNLVQNALMYTPEGGNITLGAKVGSNGYGDSVVITVSDDGPGIPAEEHARVFEAYYRASTSVGVEGSGLGLAIVAAAAKAHGGRVELDSEPGRGARFSIILPLSQ